MVKKIEEAPRSVSFWVCPIIIFVLPLLILLHTCPAAHDVRVFAPTFLRNHL